MLTDAFCSALAYACTLHQDHRRKGTDIPYVSHLLAVTALVLEAGGDERQAIAALLHDAIEDRPHGGRTAAEIERRFGNEVLEMIHACSDDVSGEDDRSVENWRKRKERYVGHLVDLGRAGSPALLVSLADKVHNARAIVADLRRHGDRLWNRFNAGREDQLWYYRALASGFREAIEQASRNDARGTEALGRLWDALNETVAAMGEGVRASGGPPSRQAR